MIRVSDTAAETRLSIRQRWSSNLVLIITFGSLLLGMLYRGNVVNATFPFTNPQLGISARYPARWLLEENLGGVVFRARDMTALPFKTTLQIRLIPTGQGARPADILNILDMGRAARLPAYRSLERVEVSLGADRRGTRMVYGYAYVGNDPFLAEQPIAVRAEDIVVLRPGQAVVITYEADSEHFETNRRYFEAFLATLSF